MINRLWLFGFVLAVPLVGLLVAGGIQARLTSDFRNALRQQLPDASADSLAQATVPAFCEFAGADNQAFCAEYGRIATLGVASAMAGGIGLGLIAFMWVAGVAARGNRRLLLVVFRPGLYLAGAVLIALVLTHAAIAVAAIYYGESALVGRVHVGLILGIGVGAIGGAIAIAKHAFTLVRNASVAVIGLAVNETDAPQLWATVTDAAGRLGALPPQNIVVGLDPNFFVTEAEVRCLSGPLNGRTLYCSLPLSRILSVPEFLAIIGHELGHFRGLDTQFSQRFFPVYRGTVNSIIALQSGAAGSGMIALLPAIALFSYFLECFSVAESRISRERELEADKAGTEVTNALATGTALVKVHAFSELWTQVHESAVTLVSQKKRFVNASKVYAEIVMSHANSEALTRVADAQQPHPTDSHPPLAVRLAALDQSLDALATMALAVTPSESAITLVKDADEAEERVTAAYQQILEHHIQQEAAIQHELEPGDRSHGSAPLEEVTSQPVTEVSCWSCKQPIPVTDERRRKKVACPHCGTKQMLPG